MSENYVVLIASGIVIPWAIWVTASIFNQRQELALLKQILEVVVKKT